MFLVAVFFVYCTLTAAFAETFLSGLFSLCRVCLVAVLSSRTLPAAACRNPFYPFICALIFPFLLFRCPFRTEGDAEKEGLRQTLQMLQRELGDQQAALSEVCSYF